MGSFWIRFRPRRWSHSEHPWIDLATAGIGLPPSGSGARGSSAKGMPAESRSDESAPEDVVYLPPCDDDEIAGSLAEWAGAAVPALVQRRVGQAPIAGSAVQIWDPLGPLLEGDDSWVDHVPAGAILVWPLLPGFAPATEEFRVACGRLHERGVAIVRPVRLSPVAPALRALADRHPRLEAIWEQLFHGRGVDERPYFSLAASAGLGVRLPRPGPTREDPRDNRSLATVLTEVGELWLRLERPESAAHDYFRAAREVELSSWKLSTLWREGNLGILDWLESGPRSVILEALEGHDPRGCATLEALWSEYLGFGDRS